MMRMYDFMLVLSPEVGEKDEKKINDLVKKLLSDAKYTVSKTEVMGKKLLAYPIKKYAEGLYVHVILEAENVSVGSIETKTKLEPLVLRYLLTRADE